ncbi:hypothetical protein DIPPA_32806 [Diplonema papillatum]|nr:hypothetical protein DIPPA_32806 [Diplonema papillatum]
MPRPTFIHPAPVYAASSRADDAPATLQRGSVNDAQQRVRRSSIMGASLDGPEAAPDSYPSARFPSAAVDELFGNAERSRSAQPPPGGSKQGAPHRRASFEDSGLTQRGLRDQHDPYGSYPGTNGHASPRAIWVPAGTCNTYHRSNSEHHSTQVDGSTAGDDAASLSKPYEDDYAHWVGDMYSREHPVDVWTSLYDSARAVQLRKREEAAWQTAERAREEEEKDSKEYEEFVKERSRWKAERARMQREKRRWQNRGAGADSPPAKPTAHPRQAAHVAPTEQRTTGERRDSLKASQAVSKDNVPVGVSGDRRDSLKASQAVYNDNVPLRVSGERRDSLKASQPAVSHHDVAVGLPGDRRTSLKTAQSAASPLPAKMVDPPSTGTSQNEPPQRDIEERRNSIAAQSVAEPHQTVALQEASPAAAEPPGELQTGGTRRSAGDRGDGAERPRESELSASPNADEPDESARSSAESGSEGGRMEAAGASESEGEAPTAPISTGTSAQKGAKPAPSPAQSTADGRAAAEEEGDPDRMVVVQVSDEYQDTSDRESGEGHAEGEPDSRRLDGQSPDGARELEDTLSGLQEEGGAGRAGTSHTSTEAGAPRGKCGWWLLAVVWGLTGRPVAEMCRTLGMEGVGPAAAAVAVFAVLSGAAAFVPARVFSHGMRHLLLGLCAACMAVSPLRAVYRQVLAVHAQREDRALDHRPGGVWYVLGQLTVLRRGETHPEPGKPQPGEDSDPPPLGTHIVGDRLSAGEVLVVVVDIVYLCALALLPGSGGGGFRGSRVARAVLFAFDPVLLGAGLAVVLAACAAGFLNADSVAYLAAARRAERDKGFCAFWSAKPLVLSLLPERSVRAFQPLWPSAGLSVLFIRCLVAALYSCAEDEAGVRVHVQDGDLECWTGGHSVVVFICLWLAYCVVSVPGASLACNVQTLALLCGVVGADVYRSSLPGLSSSFALAGLLPLVAAPLLLTRRRHSLSFSPRVRFFKLQLTLRICAAASAIAHLALAVAAEKPAAGLAVVICVWVFWLAYAVAVASAPADSHQTANPRESPSKRPAAPPAASRLASAPGSGKGSKGPPRIRPPASFSADGSSFASVPASSGNRRPRAPSSTKRPPGPNLYDDRHSVPSSHPTPRNAGLPVGKPPAARQGSPVEKAAGGPRQTLGELYLQQSDFGSPNRHGAPAVARSLSSTRGRRAGKPESGSPAAPRTLLSKVRTVKPSGKTSSPTAPSGGYERTESLASAAVRNASVPPNPLLAEGFQFPPPSKPSNRPSRDSTRGRPSRQPETVAIP